MIDLRFVPIVKWPGKPNTDRQTARFKSGYLKTLEMLKDELGKIDAREVMVQTFHQEWQIRQADGMPKANQQPPHPGVILTFKKPTGPIILKEGRRTRAVLSLSFPCDTYPDYEHNLHAIALSLAALRAVDRYGVTQNAEQYAGWKQIAAPSSNGFDSKEDAARWIVNNTNAPGCEGNPGTIRAVVEDVAFRQSYYRSAARMFHPDAPTGSQELFVKLQQAKAMLEGS